jgi:hypothetical protein
MGERADGVVSHLIELLREVGPDGAIPCQKIIYLLSCFGYLGQAASGEVRWPEVAHRPSENFNEPRAATDAGGGR